MSDKKRETFKVSATLINNYLNMRTNRYPNSHQQFLDILNRIPLKLNYALKRGNAFEEAVMKYRSEPFHDIVKPCDTQVFVSKDIACPEEDFDLKLVGYMDFATKNRKIIYDTKRVNKWSDEKYDNSVQHDFYLWSVPESEKFYYLIGSGSSWISDEYFQVEYGRPDEEELNRRCLNVIHSFINYLKEHDLLDVYKKHYNAEYKKKKEKEKQEESKNVK